jgi:hypothetical protein
VAYATQATKNVWEELHRRIIARYESDKTIDAECLFTKLAWGKDRSCHRMWVLDGKLTIRREGQGGELQGDMFLEGVKIHVEWTPTRYRGPLESVSAPVRVELRFNGRLTATFTNPPRCRADEPRTLMSMAPGTLKVTPDPEPVEIAGLVAGGPDRLQLQCPDRRDNFTQRIPGYCVTGEAASLALRRDRDQTFQCLDDFEPQHFTGRMKLDAPPAP